MKPTDTIIVGGGQAGLAMSRCLADRGVDNVVLERGQVGERWRSERWDSLRMLTPRWQSRLPGWSYTGPEAGGYMTKSEVIDYLSAYAQSFSAAAITGVRVESVHRDVDGFLVRTTSGVWSAPSVVIATGHSDRPKVPAMARTLSRDVAQVTPTAYRNPAQLRDGGVLVVGASATGVQLAAEIAKSGRPVTMAVGNHTRLPRHYRGNDIMAWFDAMGLLTESKDEVRDIVASRAQPSLQLIGSEDRRTLDLDSLQQQGVRLVGRMLGARDSDVYFAGDLSDSIQRADRKMETQLDRVDELIEYIGQAAHFPVEARPRPVPVPESPRTMSLATEHIRTVLWATGYKRRYPWLHIPVLDVNGELHHDGGVTPEPGLYALGLNFMRRRNSSFLDGVGLDAAELAEHIVDHLSRRVVRAA
jgi:putative flavoprotein involved in K+ transport